MMKPLLYLLGLFLYSFSSFAQWSTDTLPVPMTSLNSCVFQDEIYYFGGSTDTGETNVIHIYDPVQSSWRMDYLSEAKRNTACVCTDSAIYVAGGMTYNFNTTDFDYTDRIEIFKNGSWSVDTMPRPAGDMVGVRAGNHVVFAGGIYDEVNFHVNDYVYILDETTGIWTIDTLSIPRSGCGIATDGNLVAFAGGLIGKNEVTKSVEFLDLSTGEMTTDQMSYAVNGPCAAYHDGKFYFAGGALKGSNNSINHVDIYHTIGGWTGAQIGKARAGAVSAQIGSYLFFVQGSHINNIEWTVRDGIYEVDVLDTRTNKWVEVFANYARTLHAVSTYGGVLYSAGGWNQGRVKQIDMFDTTILASLFTVGWEEEVVGTEVSFFPNPSSGEIQIVVSDGTQEFEVSPYDLNGRMVQAPKVMTGFDPSYKLPDEAGIYMLRISQGDQTEVMKVVRKSR